MVTRIWGALIGAFRSSLLFLLLNIVFFLGSLAYDWLLRIFFYSIYTSWKEKNREVNLSIMPV